MSDKPDNADALTADAHDDIMYPSVLPFIAVHLGCVAAIWTGITWQAVAICVALYCAADVRDQGRISSVFLASRLLRPAGLFQFVLALLAQSTAQKSVLWWAAKHRHHHLHSDTRTGRAFAAP